MSTSASATERRGIPAAAFVEDVQTYLSQLNLDVNSALAFLQERFSLVFIFQIDFSSTSSFGFVSPYLFTYLYYGS